MNKADAIIHQIQVLLHNKKLDLAKRDNHSSKIYVIHKWLAGQYLDTVYVEQNFLGKRKKIGYYDI